MRNVDQPGRDERLENDGITEPTFGLLDVRDRGVGQLAHHLVPLANQRTELRQPSASIASPVGEHHRAQAQGEVGVTGDMPDVEQAEGDPQVCLGRRRSSR